MKSDIIHTMLQFTLLSQPLNKLVLKMDYEVVNLFGGSEVYCKVLKPCQEMLLWGQQAILI